MVKVNKSNFPGKTESNKSTQICLKYTGCSIKKVSINLLVGPAHGFNPQFLNLFGFR